MYIVPNRISEQRGWYRWCNPVLQRYQEPCMDWFCGERHNTDRMYGDSVEFLQQIGL